MLVRAVRRRPGWFSHRDGKQEGGGAQPAAAGGGVPDDPPLVVLSEPSIGRLTCPRSHTLTPVPARTCLAHHRGWANTEVSLVIHFYNHSKQWRWISSISGYRKPISISNGPFKLKFYCLKLYSHMNSSQCFEICINPSGNTHTLTHTPFFSQILFLTGALPCRLVQPNGVQEYPHQPQDAGWSHAWRRAPSAQQPKQRQALLPLPLLFKH